ncbi:AtzE family amidohydrolase [Sphingomonas sp. S-NIH.Pt15_0812]|jgi:aspartyl-tRNA(Asn)/glutamyl-tRNA(Gln) amidotransferase subunit A|uniref:AtzE family amidohydrolase n=1 Tax=Sphingomonas sp. S-NIH.Pt15_0812 TaxID=1920129 RepID=UPI000F7E82ED|nr:AtzE family amidohydrolase [Sphingomonas sp. S-NIH.Pt15_0812]RSU51111.1 AtzE family amidohydrolase [Sphingomonas sp. S-NIH.Pt15_0812]
MTRPAATARAIAADVRAGRRSAQAIATETLDRIATQDRMNASTRLLHRRALADAMRVDAVVATGGDPGPLAGVPFAVKDLFDVAGETTTAGARQRAAAPPASRDAEVVARLCAAGAVLVATTNMDEFAYGFSTENSHYGTTRNPHDPERLAGGSSGGAAALVGAGLVPLALGSDTNGSIRVPASLCGVYGLRPSFGAVSVEGAYPFVERLDTVGGFTRSPKDLAIAHAVMLGQALRPAGAASRVAVLGGWFAARADAMVLAGIDRIAAHLGAGPPIVLPSAAAARSAGFVLTGAEGGYRHLAALRRDAVAFEPATRDRLIAGALQPVAAVREAEAVAERFTAELLAALAGHDLLLAPSTPMSAPRIDATTIVVDGETLSARADLGLHTQPLSLAGVPILSVPLSLPEDAMPIGVQLIAAPGREALLFETASALVAAGLVACTPAPQEAEAA